MKLGAAMGSVNLLLAILVTFPRFALGAFDHTVTPTCDASEAVCYVTLSVNRYETMTLIDFVDGTSSPVIEINGTFYKRNKMLAADCDDVTLLTAEEMEQIYMGDGRYKYAYFINEQFPGPTISVYEGQMLEVQVENQLISEGLSIHWHGITQRGTNYMDGVGGVTQCNINPHQSFTYQFVAEPAGTHWYHSHVGAQRQDGLFGALVVLPKSEQPDDQLNKGNIAGNQLLGALAMSSEKMVGAAPSRTPEFEEEFVLLLSDWYASDASDWLIDYLLTITKFSDGNENLESCLVKKNDFSDVSSTIKFESGLINGKGRHESAQVETPREEFTVQPWKFYKFRIINSASNFGMKLNFAQHRMTVVASDGGDIEPVEADYLTIHSGETYDVYIHTDQQEGRHWINVTTTDTFAPPGKTFDLVRGHFKGVLNYEGSEETKPSSSPMPCSSADPCVNINCDSGIDQPENEVCVEVEDLMFPTPVNLEQSPEKFEEIFANFHFSNSERMSTRAVLNHHQFALPSAPLVQDGAQLENQYQCPNTTVCDDMRCKCTYILHVKAGSMVQMVLVNNLKGAGESAMAGSMPHPVHLHGTRFWVIKSGSTLGTPGSPPPLTCLDGACGHLEWTDPSWSGGNVPDVNLYNPPSKDTILLPTSSYVVIRFIADNPGYWMLHCHVDVHFADGMTAVLQVGDEEEMVKPPTGFPTCGSWTPPEL